MQFSLALIALVAPIVSGAPTSSPQEFQISDHGLQDDSNGQARDKIKRGDFEINDHGLQPESSKRSLQERDNNISSCGDNWTYVETNSDHKGYNDAVDEFCYHATHSLDGKPTTVGPKQYYSVDISGGLKLSHGDSPALVSFEVHNKLKDGSHTINEDDCKTFLKKMSAEDSKCYGENNDDTKGGTWQIGDNQISYHALPQTSLA